MAKKKDNQEDDPIQKELIKAFNNAFPDSPLESLEDSSLAEIPGWLDSGNYSLNWISSKSIFNGFPLGRIILLSGDAGTGKSLIALSLMKQPDLDYIVYLDSEGGGISKQFAQFLGINTKKVYYQPIDTIEGLIERFKLIVDTLEKNKQTSKKVLVVVDSISMLSTERELDPAAGCYVPDTQISILKDGTVITKTIKDVVEGDLVRTHLGDWQPVEKVWKFSKEEKPELIEIETEEGDVVKLTPQHRLLVSRDKKIQWIEAGDLKLSDELQKLKV